MKRLFVGVFLLAVWALFTAAAGNANDTASQIVGIILVGAPFVLPLIGKYVPLDGKKMVAIMYVLSVIAALAAGYVGGLFHGLNTMPGIMLFGTAEFGLVQLVYNALNQSGAFKVGSISIDPVKLVH